MSELKIRKDLNEMVDYIGFKHSETKYGVRNVCNVKLFNGVIIEFADKDGIYELFQSYASLDKDFILSRELVEEFKTNDDGENVGTYICVKYTLKDESVVRLFARNFNSNKLIDNYYQLYKQTKKAETPKK